MKTTATEHRPVSTMNWQADPNAIVCQNDHLFAFYKAGYRADLRRMSGHAFLECKDCTPSTYFLAVFGKLDGIAEVRCYAINKESFTEWERGDEASPATPELLYRLRDPEGKSHNPWWSPPRLRNQR